MYEKARTAGIHYIRKAICEGANGTKTYRKGMNTEQLAVDKMQ
jgi:hypothetical protein